MGKNIFLFNVIVCVCLFVVCLLCKITLGRSTKDNQIDVDLALEGPAWKISRRQGVIRLKKNGEFSILNEGKRPIYVDGRAVLTGCRDVLRSNSVIEVFIFIIVSSCL